MTSKSEKNPVIKVPLLDLKAQYKRIGEEVRKAVDEVLDSQQFILGPTVQRFEQQVASYLGCGSALGVASGSDALLLSLTALGIGAGDAVLVSPFTFFSSVSSITRLGGTPIFVDIEPTSLLTDPKHAQSVIEERCQPNPKGEGLLEARGRRVKALLLVHLFGQCCAMDPLLSLAKKHRLALVEDVAQAFGARALLNGKIFKPAGTLGDLGCFSFFPSKTLGGFGDGGLVATDRKPLAETIRMLRVHGQSSEYHHRAVGLNSRLDAVQAAVLQVKLRHIDRWCEERIQRAHHYHSLFSSTGLVGKRIIALPPPHNGRSHVFNNYVVRVERRDKLKAFLQQHGIQTEIYYPLPLHLQPCFSYLGYRKGDFPNAEQAAQEVLALPMYAELTPEQQEMVVQRVTDFYRK